MFKRQYSPSIILLTLCAALLLTVCISRIAEARSLQMDKLVYDAELLPDGSMPVSYTHL